MKYEDLKSFNVRDWDGTPFLALVWDEDDCTAQIEPDEHPFKIVGFIDGRWYDKDGFEWDFACREFEGVLK